MKKIMLIIGANPGKPQLSDPTKSTGAYGLPKEYIDKIRAQAIKGIGKIQKPPLDNSNTELPSLAPNPIIFNNNDND